MKKGILLLMAILSFHLSFANDLDEELILLAKIYRNFSGFEINTTTSDFKAIDEIKSRKLENASRFVKECITTKNKLTSEEFLKIPDEQTLENLYLVKQICINMGQKESKSNVELLATLRDKGTPRYELIENYYTMVFSGVGNKNQPFNLSNINFIIDNYNLTDDTEKGIFFLSLINFCYVQVWGYMNIVQPPNYKKVMENIDKYPKINGQEYYKYADFGFPDFYMQIITGKEAQSYKDFCINRFYNILIYHHQCLSRNKRTRKAAEELALSSILSKRSYYDYSKNKDYLNGLFRTIEMD